MGGQAAQKGHVALLGRRTSGQSEQCAQGAEAQELTACWPASSEVAGGGVCTSDPKGAEGASRQLCGRDVGTWGQSWPRARGTHMLREQRVHGGGPVRGRSLCPRGRRHGDLPWLPSLRAALMSPRGPPGPPWWHSVPSGSPGTPAGLPADCRGRWESFVEETLTETNRRNAVDLVSGAGRPLGPRPSRQPQRARPGAGLTPTPSAVAGEHPPPSSLERGRGHGGRFP